MLKMTIKSVAGFCAGCCLAQPVLAWNSLGHQVVAQVAYNHLDPEVKAKCDALIALNPVCGSVSHTFVSDSTWADARCESWTSPQHYIDLPIILDSTNEISCVIDPINVVTAINQYVATLQNPNATLSSQSTALRYLIHFVGDIEQPLHSSTAISASNNWTCPGGDLGGNDFNLNGTWSDLHKLWDAGGGFLSSGTASSKAAVVEAAYPYTPSIGTIPDPMTWAQESYWIARTNAYVGIAMNSTPSVAYTNKAQTTTAQRMAIGGQRLAKLLNTIFVTNGPTVTSVSFSNTNFGLSWSSVSGRIYRVQWKQELGDAAWSNLVDVTASGAASSYNDANTESQRYYRVIVVN
jgi:hypothetical protein